MNTLHHWGKVKHSDPKPMRDESNKKSMDWLLGMNCRWIPIFMNNYIEKNFDESSTRGTVIKSYSKFLSPLEICCCCCQFLTALNVIPDMPDPSWLTLRFLPNNENIQKVFNPAAESIWPLPFPQATIFL